MLPKVANHIIHHTSRAVLAVQNQTGHTIRNVLQLQTSTAPSNAAGNLSPWNSPGSSSSGWGSSSSGPGGAKYHSNSRFYSNHGNTGIGRATTLVDPSVSHSQNADSFDDPDELSLAPPIRPRQRQRTRSSSLSFSTAQDRDDYIARNGILRTVQLHVRARHAFASIPAHSAITEGSLKKDDVSSVPQPLALHEQPNAAASELDDELLKQLEKAKKTRDLDLALEQVKKMRESSQPPSTTVFNSAISCLENIRRSGESLQHVLQVYHDMINRSVVPNFWTYTLLILALTKRDWEIHDTIRVAESRLRARTATGDLTNPGTHAERIARLRSENNFGSALTLFHAATMVPRSRIPLQVYSHLMRTCALHLNVDAAIHVYAHLEKRKDILPTPSIFRDLIHVYVSAGDLQGAKEVFDEFRSACQSQRLDTSGRPSDDSVASGKFGVIPVWNKMIEAYIGLSQPAAGLGLLEQMMDTPAGPDFSLADPPLPSSMTFASVITAFIESDDIDSALTWFNRLLAQDDKPLAPHLPVTNPTRPHLKIWSTVFDGLIQRNMFEELARVLEAAKKVRGDLPSYIFIDTLNSFTVHCLSHPEITSDGVIKVLGLLREIARPALARRVQEEPFNWANLEKTFSCMYRLYIQCGLPAAAVEVAEELISRLNAEQVSDRRRLLIGFFETLYPQVLSATAESNWSISNAMHLFRLSRLIRISYSPQVLAQYLEPFAYATPEQKTAMAVEDWEAVISLGVQLSKTLVPAANSEPRVVSLHTLLMDAAQYGMLGEVPTSLLRSVGEILSDDELTEVLVPVSEQTRLYLLGCFRRPLKDGPSYNISTSILDVKKTQEPVHVDGPYSRFIEDCLIPPPLAKPLDAYSRLEAGKAKSLYPSPGVIAKLIPALGRIGELEKVGKVYDVAQLVLASMEKSRQTAGWFFIEDAMIIALAHAGDVDGAHAHRTRILERGGTPSADAYGALIQNVKDTTDDASSAMALFNEAVARGTDLNIFFYNTAISKLARARKADQALGLFQQMKANDLRPTSVTYGAVIAACCRVGDAQSAEALFQEMSTQSNFKPRIPPYNTMMQLYTHTKPNRERVLHYYNELLRAQVRPTAHTYKLLLDAYGTIEPVDLGSMQKVFDDLVADNHVQVQGTHWAALINAWGCVSKDLDKAITVFDSIRTHPSTQRSNSGLPDAVTFEALINVLVTHRRTDLFPIYIEKLSSHNIHMTAYIANLLIKGYAAVGNIEKSREVFEGLVDPPEGVAAPNNHAPHNGETINNSSVPADAPVYREPSTWEAMVRAELGNGNRDQAIALLERVQARRFPIAVYNRISGIMLDDSVSPWAQSPESASPVSSSSSQ